MRSVKWAFKRAVTLACWQCSVLVFSLRPSVSAFSLTCPGDMPRFGACSPDYIILTLASQDSTLSITLDVTSAMPGQSVISLASVPGHVPGSLCWSMSALRLQWLAHNGIMII